MCHGVEVGCEREKRSHLVNVVEDWLSEAIFCLPLTCRVNSIPEFDSSKLQTEGIEY